MRVCAQQIARSARFLEAELERELDEPRIPCRLDLSKLISTDFDGYWFNLTRSANWTPQRVHVVPDIEEVGTKFDAHSLTERKCFQERNVPILRTRATCSVPSAIP